MSKKVILYHASHCPPCIRFIESGNWNRVQEMCQEADLGIEFEEYDRDIEGSEAIFKKKYIEATPTIVIINGGKEERTHVQDPKKIFDMIKSGQVVQHGGGCASCNATTPMVEDPYYHKYLKYKIKYWNLKNQ